MRKVEINLLSFTGIMILTMLIIVGLTKVYASTKVSEIAEEPVSAKIEIEPNEIIEKAKISEVVKTIQIEEVQISKDMDLTVTTGLSKEDFITLIQGLKYDSSNFFEENAETIYDLCQEYSINEIFFCGLIAEESGWNIASNHRRTHNYISLMSNGKLISYESVYDGLQIAAQKLRDNYFTEGGKFYHGKTLSGLKVCFCPASSTWIDAVYGRMKSVLK